MAKYIFVGNDQGVISVEIFPELVDAIIKADRYIERLSSGSEVIPNTEAFRPKTLRNGLLSTVVEIHDGGKDVFVLRAPRLVQFMLQFNCVDKMLLVGTDKLKPPRAYRTGECRMSGSGQVVSICV